MSITSCDCDNPTFGNFGRPNCVIEMRPMAFPIFFPRFKSDGSRNTLDVTSATLGADILALVSAATDAQERLYIFPRVEEPTWERTDTVFDTASSTRKYKVFGVGGVYTVKFQTWAKDAAFQILREAEKMGCSEFDFLNATVDGNLWGVKDDKTDTVLRGYEVSAETWDCFVEFATNTTVQKGMFEFDLDNAENVKNSYAITKEEMVNTGGVPSTSLRPNITGCQTLTALLSTEIESYVFTGFGSAGNRDEIEGLLLANFTVFNETTDLAVVPSGVVETSAGTYTITIPAQTATDVLRVSVINATGYDVEDNTVAAI